MPVVDDNLVIEVVLSRARDFGRKDSYGGGRESLVDVDIFGYRMEILVVEEIHNKKLTKYKELLQLWRAWTSKIV